jgi:hypothetical protein
MRQTTIRQVNCIEKFTSNDLRLRKVSGILNTNMTKIVTKFSLRSGMNFTL